MSIWLSYLYINKRPAKACEAAIPGNATDLLRTEFDLRHEGWMRLLHRPSVLIQPLGGNGGCWWPHRQSPGNALPSSLLLKGVAWNNSFGQVVSGPSCQNHSVFR